MKGHGHWHCKHIQFDWSTFLFFSFFFWKWSKWLGGRYVIIIDTNHNHMSCKSSVILHLQILLKLLNQINKKRKKVKVETEFKTIKWAVSMFLCFLAVSLRLMCLLWNIFIEFCTFISHIDIIIYFHFILAVTIFVLLLV